MWRTVIVTKGEKITVRDHWLVVYSDQNEARIPIEDIYSVVIDNRQTLLSVNVMNTLAAAGAHIIFCGEDHMPLTVQLPLNTHYRPLNVIQSQFQMSQQLKDDLWGRIIYSKIDNQIRVLKLSHVYQQKWEVLEKLRDKIKPGDPTNMEAIAAKKYFPSLFGSFFTRQDDDVTNAALNYGYAIIRSAVAKTLVAYGYNCVLGIHHIGDKNPFNLADDMMEPLRPLVDYWTDSHVDELFGTLTRSNRADLVALVNHVIRMEGKKMRVRYAIDQYIRSFTSAVKNEDASLLKIPVIIQSDPFFEDDLDG